MKKALLFTPLMALFFNACGSQSDELSEPKVVIGSNDLVKYTADDTYSQAVGVMVSGCTVTHIGGNLGLTAGHCVTGYSCEENYDVVWNYRENNQGDGTRSRSSCVEVLSRQYSSSVDTPLDYAIVRYDRAPEAYRQIDFQKPVAGDEITILSHPAVRTLEWSGWCTIDGNWSANKFAYQCDTEGGSSGAAVLNRSLRVVGVHNLGSSAAGYNAGSYMVDVFSDLPQSLQDELQNLQL
ncbi:trypsin-like serine peptidase [Pseudobacteriovorax antillogorgiicola]|uniref:Serine protease n=1 Tax=Pseudobacteriovorax antillogorgiicola TaxID=1513793 RepID=A0A1Y6C8S6_9BACT|nr:trypsin-like peptidase domain-containing protein [Pseudobacteriovorax antillogorgiicola]TCS51730.1 V8-like Glu-specific endopeptidase [Pseudobacteriovorax antillogorgiicola]SMF49537.1 V8-like Glu-specific endopeptidase [Pseudobacteriovorax antillogorgiicola]